MAGTLPAPRFPAGACCCRCLPRPVEIAEHERREEHQEAGRLPGVEPGPLADLVGHRRLVIAEDVAEDAAAVRCAAAAEEATEPAEAVQEAAVMVRQGVLELLGAAGLLDVLMEPAEQGVERRRNRLAGGVRVGAELLAELRDRLIVKLLLDHVDQGQGAPPLR